MKKVRLSALSTGHLYSPSDIPGTDFCCGPGSSVGIATELPGCTGRNGIPVGTRFSDSPDRPWGPPVKWVPGLSRG